MSHRNLALSSLASLEKSLHVLFDDEALRASPRLVEVISNAQFFLGQAQMELQGLVMDYDDLKRKLFPLLAGESA